MSNVHPYVEKKEHLVIGLMSGTSCDGVDAALVRISGTGLTLSAREIAFASIPYQAAIRKELLDVSGGEYGGSHSLTLLSFLLGELFNDAALAVCRKAGVHPSDVDLIGSHGHTVYHIPRAEEYLGHMMRGTLQIGDVSMLCETFSCPVASDFRVRDFAAGGQGAPLVPYTEYLLYRDDSQTVALQNIGGIGNVTIIPRGCSPSQVIAFDTGPGNMVIDALVSHYTNGKQLFDEEGAIASRGKPHKVIMNFLELDSYPALPFPKTTGREKYGPEFVSKIIKLSEMNGISFADVIASATLFTARCIRQGLSLPGLARPDMLVVGGGGSHNKTLLGFLERELPGIKVMTEEALGYCSDSKEAVAFAILANECACGTANSIPSATGASHPVVLGRLQFENYC